MSRINLEGNRLADFFVERGMRLNSLDWVPVDNEVITANHPPLLIMAPAGAIDILMPASTALLKGLTFVMMNASANAITLKTSGDAAFTTAIALAANETTVVVCTGHATAALGWRAVGTASSA